MIVTLIVFKWTYFMSMIHFYAPWKRQEARRFLTFSGGVCRNRTRCQMGQNQNFSKAGSVSHWRLSGVFTVNFENISHLVLVFLLVTLHKYSLVSVREGSTSKFWKLYPIHGAGCSCWKWRDRVNIFRLLGGPRICGSFPLGKRFKMALDWPIILF